MGFIHAAPDTLPANSIDQDTGNHLHSVVSKLKRPLAHAAILGVGLFGLYNGGMLALDSQDSQPDLSKAASQTATAYLGHKLDILCNDVIMAPQYNEANKSIEILPANGAVAIYASPIGLLPGKRIHLNTDVCKSLASMPSPGKREPLNIEQLKAIVDTAHEKQHTEDVLNEARAQCKALQASAGVLENLNYNTAPAYAAIAEHSQSFGANYNSPKCVVGGEWDENNQGGTSNAWLPKE